MVHMNSMLSFSSDELRFDDQFLNSQTYPAGSSVKGESRICAAPTFFF